MPHPYSNSMTAVAASVSVVKVGSVIMDPPPSLIAFFEPDTARIVSPYRRLQHVLIIYAFAFSKAVSGHRTPCPRSLYTHLRSLRPSQVFT